ncbi:hypothetical protein [Paracoccus tegillarcae]|uniref:Uncharacterized protein n=1 Tax=Paracoccus tegillarcae TaxID=1529068 RepID=A0A2K9EIV9_9RHOB|nr:hypothetical protein [Paracoccus tegillarcae]AUH34920.1 hypothetical protein CUV01_17425 [Paracoccus tegillarcae]
MSDAIDEYLDDLKHRHTNHDTYWALPLSTAYTTAYDNVSATLDADSKRRQAEAELIADLILLGVSIPIGGVLTARLGAAVSGKSLASKAAKMLAQRNSARASMVAGLLRTDTGAYVIGETYGAIKKHIKSSTQSKIASVLAYNPLSGLQGLGENPLILKNRLQEFNGRHYDAAASFATDVRDNKEISSNVKSEIAAVLRKSSYFTGASHTGQFSQPAALAQDIEIMMWSAYILNTDYWEQAQFDRFGKEHSDGMRKVRLGPVDGLPSNPDYGKNGPRGNTSDKNRSVFDAVTLDASPVYREPGSIIMRRIETLWSARISKSSSFAKGKYDVGELKDAEAASNVLSSRYGATTS